MSYRKFNQLGPQDVIPQSYQVMEIQNFEHKQDLLRKNAILCIDVHANWCQPCKQLSPAYATMAKQYGSPGRCLLVKEDVEHGLSKDFQVTAVPTFLIFYRGSLYKRFTGGDLKPIEETLKELMEEFNTPQEPTHPTVDPGFAPHQYGMQPPSRPQHAQPGPPRHPHAPSRGFQGPSQGPPQGFQDQGPPQSQHYQPQQYQQPNYAPDGDYRQNFGASCQYNSGGPDNDQSQPTFNAGNRHNPRR